MFLPPAGVGGKFLINKDDSSTKQQKRIFFKIILCKAVKTI
jgi:hypothetical protein